MKRTFLILFMIATATWTVESCYEKPEEDTPVIGKAHLTLEDDLLNPLVMNHLGRVSDPVVSPDGKRIVYGVSYTSVEENRSNRELYVMNIDGSNNHLIGATAKSESNARWLDDNTLLYLSGGKLWRMNADGTQRRQIEGTDKPISEFTLSPQKDHLLFVSSVPSITRPVDRYPNLDKATGRIIDGLMYRHWDCFVEDIPHSFTARFDGLQMSDVKDLLEGEPYELPTLPFGGIGELSWSPSQKYIAYSCRKLTSVAYATSTNTDIYLYDMQTSQATNLSEGMMGYDTAPVFSPDEKYLVWCSMERDGYEADKIRLMCYDFADGSIRELTKDFKYNVEGVSWMSDSKGLYFSSCAEGVTQVFSLDLASAEIRQITNGLFDCSAVQPVGKGDALQLIGTYASISMPTEIVSINPQTGAYTPLTQENKEILDQLTLGNVEGRWITTTDNKKMLTWVVYPPHFDPTQKYPMILFCAGGPQSTLSQSWSYRWCHQLIAANGYIVILPNRRGTTAFGQEWCEQISGDYAGQNMQDYLSAVDYMKQEPFVDGAHVGAVGASYGGYSIYYLAGHHDKRFAAFVAHAGIFNTEHMYMETEEIWFPHWDNGGAPWDTNPVATRHYAQSPHKSVKNWDTPILITHGELDYRVPVDQAMTAFNAAQLLGVPSKMLLFPDENHWILKPQNNILWNNVFFEFLDKYLK